MQPTTSDHFDGKLDLNNIQLHGHLGSGASGRVFKGVHGPTNLPFAVKKMQKLYEKEYKSALEEAKLLYNLSHENIVHLKGWKEDKDKFGYYTISLIMEYCNETLEHRLKSWKIKCIEHYEWMLQMSSGLAYLHSMGVVHRDLKPGNVLVKQTLKGERLKLSDFGLSKVMPQTENLKSQVFPLMYGAPEVIYGHGVSYNSKADVFSLGCVCYGMLEYCFEVVAGEKHFSAFVFIPELGRVSLGEALVSNEFLEIGITKTGKQYQLEDSLKELTLEMLRRNPEHRLTAEDVKQRLKKIEIDYWSRHNVQS